MSFLSNFFAKKNTAPVAKDRLQILLAHERSSTTTANSDLLQKLEKEIMEVIQKHISIDQDKIQVKVDRGNDFSTLEIDIEVPEQIKKFD